MSGPRYSIGKETAIKLAESRWWERDGLSARDIAGFQLLTAELCMDFSAFHKALEDSLGRSVFTHELGLNYDRIVKEFLGKKEAPTFEQILALLPKDKTVMVTV
jgi:hypothetical protein